MEIKEFLTNVQGSDEQKNAFLSEFSQSEMGKNYLGLYLKNNSPFNVDDKNQIINDDKLDPRIGAFVGFERSQVHESRDAKIEALTGIKRNEGETKGYAERALKEWRASEVEKVKALPNEELNNIKNNHIQELQKLKDSNLAAINDWEKKYNDLKLDVEKEKINNDWQKELSLIGLDLSSMNAIQEAGINAIIEAGKGMYGYENGEGVIKNADGTIQRKANQENVTIKDYLTSNLSDVLTPQIQGGGYNGSSGKGAGSATLVSSSKSRTEVRSKFDELMQKKGISSMDKEYALEYAKIVEDPNYKSLPL